ncbi:hypothetical protein [Methylobacterium oryzisoli]|uniref:hypothetical protein n=1 Tax=Methylobacterium oryzisoli TaxID=3385502 RepID=UPI0038915C3B
MEIRRTAQGFEIVPEAWAADRPGTSTAAIRSWAELADYCEALAVWCAMVLETRQIDPHARDIIRIEHASMVEAVAAYRHWAALHRPFRGIATRPDP